MVNPLAGINQASYRRGVTTMLPPALVPRSAVRRPVPTNDRGGSLADRIYREQQATGHWAPQGAGSQSAGPDLGGLGWVVGKAGKAAMGALSVLDYPRAGVTSTIRELLDTQAAEALNKGIAALPGIDYTPIAGVENEGFDWGDLWRNTRERKGFGELISDPQFEDSPGWLKNTVGFAGDIAADPFTYVTMGTGATMGGMARGTYLNELLGAQKAIKAEREAAELALQNIPSPNVFKRAGAAERVAAKRSAAAERVAALAKQEADLGDLDTLERIGRRGVNVATPQQAAAMGLDAPGVRFGGVRIPGTGGAGAAWGKATGPLKEVISAGPVGRGARALHTPTGYFGQSMKPALERIIAGTGGGTIEPAVRAIAVNQNARRIGNTFRSVATRELGKWSQETKDLTNDAKRALIRQAEEEGADNVMTTMASRMRAVAADLGVELPQFHQVINGKEVAYTPHVFSREAYNWFNKLRRSQDPRFEPIRRALNITPEELMEEGGFLQRRALRPNEDGTPLALKVGDDTIEIERGSLDELEDKLGGLLRKSGFDGKLYETDPVEAWRRYINATSRDVAKRGAARDAAAMGFPGHFPDPGRPEAFNPYGKEDLPPTFTDEGEEVLHHRVTGPEPRPDDTAFYEYTQNKKETLRQQRRLTGKRAKDQREYVKGMEEAGAAERARLAGELEPAIEDVWRPITTAKAAARTAEQEAKDRVLAAIREGRTADLDLDAVASAITTHEAEIRSLRARVGALTSGAKRTTRARTKTLLDEANRELVRAQKDARRLRTAYEQAMAEVEHVGPEAMQARREARDLIPDAIKAKEAEVTRFENKAEANLRVTEAQARAAQADRIGGPKPITQAEAAQAERTLREAQTSGAGRAHAKMLEDRDQAKRVWARASADVQDWTQDAEQKIARWENLDARANRAEKLTPIPEIAAPPRGLQQTADGKWIDVANPKMRPVELGSRELGAMHQFQNGKRVQIMRPSDTETKRLMRLGLVEQTDELPTGFKGNIGNSKRFKLTEQGKQFPPIKLERGKYRVQETGLGWGAAPEPPKPPERIVTPAMAEIEADLNRLNKEIAARRAVADDAQARALQLDKDINASDITKAAETFNRFKRQEEAIANWRGTVEMPDGSTKHYDVPHAREQMAAAREQRRDWDIIKREEKAYQERPKRVDTTLTPEQQTELKAARRALDGPKSQEYRVMRAERARLTEDVIGATQATRAEGLSAGKWRGMKARRLEIDEWMKANKRVINRVERAEAKIKELENLDAAGFKNLPPEPPRPQWFEDLDKQRQALVERAKNLEYQREIVKQKHGLPMVEAIARETQAKMPLQARVAESTAYKTAAEEQAKVAPKLAEARQDITTQERMLEHRAEYEESLLQKRDESQQNYLEALQDKETARATHEDIKTKAEGLDKPFIPKETINVKGGGTVERTKTPTKIDLQRVSEGTLRSYEAQPLNRTITDIDAVIAANPASQPQEALNRIEAVLESVEQDLARLTTEIDLPARETDKILIAAKQGKLEPVLKAQLKGAYTMLWDNADVIVAKDLMQMYYGVERVLESKLFGRTFTAMTDFFKTYATLSPGFHIRNALSAIFMNSSEGVSARAQLRGLRLWREYANAEEPLKWLAARPAHERAAFEATFASGAGGQFLEAGVSELRGGKARFTEKLFANRATRFSQRIGQDWVEGPARLSLALNSTTPRKLGGRGMNVSQALDRVTRVHFDYSQVSKFDEKMKRIVPFWTFMSRNIPLQFTQMWSKPRTYLHFQSFARNYSVEPPEFMPEYLKQQGVFDTGLRTPEWMSKIPVVGTPAGMPIAVAADLPHLRLKEDIERTAQALSGNNQGQILSDVNPFFTAPFEYMMGQDFYTGKTYGPDDVTQASGLGVPLAAALSGIGGGERGPNGEWYLDDKTMNLLRSLNPVLERTSRLTPALWSKSKGGQDRQLESYLRFLGAPVRTISEEQMQSEQARRYYDELDRRRHLAAIGG